MPSIRLWGLNRFTLRSKRKVNTQWLPTAWCITSARSKPQKRADIHIIVAEGSALDLSYGQDRGIGSKSGAAEQMTDKLMVELREDIRRCYGKDKVKLHYLSMPLALRSGVGTHWMLPTSMVVRRPEVFPWDKQAAQAHRLDADKVRTLIDGLHRSDPHKYLPVTAEIRDVWEWICHFTDHRHSWQRLVETLGAPKPKIL